MEAGEPSNPIPLASEGEDSQPSWYNSDEELYSDSDEEIIGYDDDVTRAAAARATHSTPQHLTPAGRAATMRAEPGAAAARASHSTPQRLMPAGRAAMMRAEPGAPAKTQPSTAAGLAGIRQGLGSYPAGGVGDARRKASRKGKPKPNKPIYVDDAGIGGTDDEMFDAMGDLKSERLPASHAKKEYKGALVLFRGSGYDTMAGLSTAISTGWRAQEGCEGARAWPTLL